MEKKSNFNLDIDDTSLFYMKTIKKYKSITKEDEKKLLFAYKHNNDIYARNYLINVNLKYACKLANKYRGRGFSFSELISEANNALIFAIDKFDETQDVKLISYARWWINQRLDKMVTDKKNLNEEELPTENDKISLNENVDFSQEYDNEEIYINHAFLDENEAFKNEEKSKLLDKLFSILNEREIELIKMRFGIEPYEKEYTLDEISSNINLSGERIRQIIDKCFLKMRTQALIFDKK